MSKGTKVLIYQDGEFREWDFATPEIAHKAFNIAANAVYEKMTNQRNPEHRGNLAYKHESWDELVKRVAGFEKMKAHVEEYAEQ
jgi:hypothetical protein